jgi:hypothetical protein
MSAHTIFLGRLFGLFTLLYSLAMFAHKRTMVETAMALVSDRPLLLIVGMIIMAIGLAMVLAHNVWSGRPLTIIVTLIGWILLLRGVTILFLDPEAVVRLFAFFRPEQLFYAYAGLVLIVSLYLIYSSFGRKEPAVSA